MTLRMANFLMIGRQFDRVKGKVVVRKSGPLDWDWRAVAALVRATRKVCDEEVGDEMPNLDPKFVRRVRESSA